MGMTTMPPAPDIDDGDCAPDGSAGPDRLRQTSRPSFAIDGPQARCARDARAPWNGFGCIAAAEA